MAATEDNTSPEIDLDAPVTRRELMTAYDNLKNATRILSWMVEATMDRTGVSVGDVRAYIDRMTTPPTSGMVNQTKVDNLIWSK